MPQKNVMKVFYVMMELFAKIVSCITSQNGKTHFKNLAGNITRFSKCVWPFRDVINERVTRFFIYKQQFYRQRQAEIVKKIKQKLSNTLELNLCLCYLKIFRFLHLCYHPKIIQDILKNVQKLSTPVSVRLYD